MTVRRLATPSGSLASVIAALVLAAAGERTLAQEPKPSDPNLTIRFLLERIERLERQIDSLTRRVDATGTEAPSAAAAAPRERASAAAAQPTGELTGLDASLVQRGGLLLPAGVAEIEAGVSYANASSDNVSITGFTIFPVLVVGDITSERVRRRWTSLSLAGRVGLPHDFQAEVRVPYTFTSLQRVTADNRETTDSAQGLGDIELGIAKQLYHTTGRWPDVLGRLQWKSSTGKGAFDDGGQLALGTGFDSLRASLTAVKSTDPAAVLATLGYTYTFPADKSIGRVAPGGVIDLSLGTALGLSPDLALNFSVQQRFVQSTKVNGTEVAGSSQELGSLRLGATYTLTAAAAVDFGVGIGLTRDAPDYALAGSFIQRF
jgi:hypothetical protein